jgi:hypothetical protein
MHSTFPGDFHWESEGGGTQVTVGVGSSIFLSLLFSAFLWVQQWCRQRAGAQRPAHR